MLVCAPKRPVEVVLVFCAPKSPPVAGAGVVACVVAEPNNPLLPAAPDVAGVVLPNRPPAPLDAGCEVPNAFGFCVAAPSCFAPNNPPPPVDAPPNSDGVDGLAAALPSCFCAPNSPPPVLGAAEPKRLFVCFGSPAGVVDAPKLPPTPPKRPPGLLPCGVLDPLFALLPKSPEPAGGAVDVGVLEPKRPVPDVDVVVLLCWPNSEPPPAVPVPPNSDPPPVLPNENFGASFLSAIVATQVVVSSRV